MCFYMYIYTNFAWSLPIHHVHPNSSNPCKEWIRWPPWIKPHPHGGEISLGLVPTIAKQLVKHPIATVAAGFSSVVSFSLDDGTVSGAYAPKEGAAAIGEATIHSQADGHTHLVGRAPDPCSCFAVCCACNNNHKIEWFIGRCRSICSPLTLFISQCNI